MPAFDPAQELPEAGGGPARSPSIGVARERDTIVALSTALGAGAIGIVRMSGPRAVELGRLVFRPLRASGGVGESHRLVYGRVVDPRTDEPIDEVLFVSMSAPATYTREDVVEIHCHGGPAATRSVLSLLIREGARPAEPGEFTKRAFLNGRLDLTQAESVASIVQARTGSALKAAVRQLEGGLGDELRLIRGELVSLLARVEATIDFSEEDVDDLDRDGVVRGLRVVGDRLEALLETAFTGRALEEGVRTAIIGRPNVGKSSLLNALLLKERAIVSHLPGTTRDTVEEFIEVGGVPLRLIDTAGLRTDADEIEQLGIERSRRAAGDADLALVVLDAADGVTAEDRELLDSLSGPAVVVVLNKTDLLDGRDGRREALTASLGDGRRVVEVSALRGTGLEELRRIVSALVCGEGGISLDEPLLATERQRHLVGAAAQHVVGAVQALIAGRADELAAEDIRAAVEDLGAVTGEEVVPDLLDEIFRQFCIGK